MKTSRFLFGAMALVSIGCVTPGQPVGSSLGGKGVAEQVAFDHSCPEARVLVIRSGGYTMDLDVCGTVRRYKGVANGNQLTWLDVTSSYPASALPAPLQAPAGK